MARGLLVGLFCGCIAGGVILAGAALRHGAAPVASRIEAGVADAFPGNPDIAAGRAEAPVAPRNTPAPVPAAAPEPPSAPPDTDMAGAGQIPLPELAPSAPENLPGPVTAAAPPVIPGPALNSSDAGRSPRPPAMAQAAPDAVPPAPAAEVIVSDAPEPGPPPLGGAAAGQPGAVPLSVAHENPSDAVTRIAVASAADEVPVPSVDIESAGPPPASAAPAIAETTALASAVIPVPSGPSLPSRGDGSDVAQRSRPALLAPTPEGAATPHVDLALPQPAATAFDRNRLPASRGDMPMIAFLIQSPRSDLPDWSMSFVGSRPPENSAESFRPAGGVAFRSAGSIVTQGAAPATAISAAARMGEALVVIPQDASICVAAAESGVPCAQIYTRLRPQDEGNGDRLDAALLRARRDGMAIVALPDDDALRALVSDWLGRHQSEVAPVPVSTVIDRWR